MCGGVVAATCSALPLQRGAPWRAHLPYVLSYNAGRIGSYAAAGAIAGALGASLASFAIVERAQLGLRLGAGALMVIVGLYVAGFGSALRWVERAGEPAWRRIAKLARRFVPVRSPAQALALGLLWGWMPCGLVAGAARVRWVRTTAGIVLVALGSMQAAHAWAASSAVIEGSAHACCAGHQ